MPLPRLVRVGLAVVAATALATGCSAQATPLAQTAPASSPSAAATPPPSPASEPSPPASESAPATPTGAPSVTTREMTDGILTDFYLPGQMAILRVPPTPGPTPLVVVVPGGGWRTSDPVDYRPLAEALTAAGISTSLITYSTTDSGAQFPRPIDDVACAIRWSAFQLSALGYPPSRVVVVGHSAGGQLATEVAFTGDEFGADCPMPPVTIDGVVGLAGVYDLADPAIVPAALFPGGGTADERSQFSPLNVVNDPANALPPIDVLLMSGTNDDIVPPAQTEQMAAALRARGIEPTVQTLPLGHNMGFPLALEIAPIIKAWVLGEPYVPPSASAVASPAAS